MTGLLLRTLPGLALLGACARDPNALPDISYDHEVCDHCGMMISDPATAAAIVTRDGNTFAFDDPGCLFRFVVEHPQPAAHLWFSDGTRWYTESEVAFRTGGTTPMGSGLMTVPKGTPGALGVGEASGLALTP